jgi:hypothetical protein
MDQQNPNNGFRYTYSAKEQAEIKKIREKYAPAEPVEEKMERLRRLDAGVTQRARAVALTLGVLGTLSQELSTMVEDFNAANPDSLVKVRAYYNYLWNEKVRYVYQWVINCWAESGNRGWDFNRCASWVVPSPKGPLSTLRMENTREGIEDYEYCAKLERECVRLAKKAPELAAQGRILLKKAAALTGRSFDDNDRVVLCNDPMAYEILHRQAGALLEAMGKVK